MTRLALMAQGKRVLQPEIWPGLEGPDGQPLSVKLRVLTCSEVQDCHARAVRRFEVLRLPIDAVHTVELFEDEVRLQVLVIACRDADDPSKPLAIDDADLRDHTTVQQREAMFDRYHDFALSVNPSPDEMTDEEVRSIIDAVKKKDRAALLGFGSRKLAAYLLTSVNPQSI